MVCKNGALNDAHQLPPSNGTFFQNFAAAAAAAARVLCAAKPPPRHATPMPRRLTAKQQTHAGASWW